MYSSNAYLILGDWSAIDDVNTLIDVGNDSGIIDRIATAPTGLGKKPVDQVIITHNHSDHTGILPRIRERYTPVVYAKTPYMGADAMVTDGQVLHCGDRYFEVIHTPGHSDDSICLYCQSDGVLFVGDTPVLIRSPDSTYKEPFIRAFERLCQLDVRTIYFGHGAPMTEGAKAALQESLVNIHA
jgi:glyoxylase-like metal-dependent hydrolase (beta-lactamase superfamily II)